MRATIRIRRRLHSETVHPPELRDFTGRDVEIVVREVDAEQATVQRHPPRGSVLRYDDPFEPIAEDDREALA